MTNHSSNLQNNAELWIRQQQQGLIASSDCFLELYEINNTPVISKWAGLDVSIRRLWGACVGTYESWIPWMLLLRDGNWKFHHVPGRQCSSWECTNHLLHLFCVKTKNQIQEIDAKVILSVSCETWNPSAFRFHQAAVIKASRNNKLPEPFPKSDVLIPRVHQ